MPITRLIPQRADFVEPQPALVSDPNLLVDDDELARATADFEEAEDGNAEMVLESFLELYLQINPDPTDDEVHKLAASVRLSKEALEGVIYSMLAERVAAEENGEVPDLDDEDDEFEDDDETAEIALHRSIILDPQNTEEEMVNDGEPDEYNAHQNQ